MAFSDPEKNISELHLREGVSVADLGTGTGVYAIAAGKRVGTHGRVYAIEVQKDLLLNVQSAAEAAKLENIEVIWGDIEAPGGTKIADRSLDALIIANTLFLAEDKRAFLAEAARIAKSGATVLFVEWADSFGGIGPAQGDVLPPMKARELLTAAGFSVEKQFEAGDHHYGFIARRI